MDCAHKAPEGPRHRRIDAQPAAAPLDPTAIADHRPAAPLQRALHRAIDQSPRVRSQLAWAASIQEGASMASQRATLANTFGKVAEYAGGRVALQDRRPMPAATGPATAQRMVAVAADDMGAVDDALVLNNLDYAIGQFGGPVGDFKANRKFDATRPGDRVGIIHHGSPGQIGGYDAAAVAKALTRPPGIDKELASIVLYSCNAGMDQDKKGPDSSLVHLLSAALKDRGYEIGVEGLKGIGFGFQGIGERTTKGTEAEGDKNWFSTRDKLFLKPEYSRWQASGGGFLPANEFLEVAGQLPAETIQKMSMEDKARKISDIMAPYWREVEQAMGDKLYDQFKGWVRVKSYVAGGQLVQDTR